MKPDTGKDFGFITDSKLHYLRPIHCPTGLQWIVSDITCYLLPKGIQRLKPLIIFNANKTAILPTSPYLSKV